MPRIATVILFVSAILAGCAEFPDLDATIADQGTVAGFPTLVPIDPILFAASFDLQNLESQATALAARVRQLKVRAQAMQRPVIDRRTRTQMAAALRRHPG